MINYSYRLKKRKEFAYMYKKGKSYNQKELSLVVLPTKLKHARFGFSVSKKVGKAFERNLIKRRLLDIVSRLLSNINNSNNYVIVAKPQIKSLSFNELYEITKNAFILSGNYNESNSNNN